MLKRPYYIINDLSSIDLLQKKEQKFIFAITITAHESLNKIFKTIYESCVNPFCLYIPSQTNESVLNSVIDDLILVSFHHEYIRPVLNEVLILSDGAFNSIYNHISESFIAQGYQRVRIKHFNSELDERANEDKIYLINDVLQAEDKYYDFLNSRLAVECQVIIDAGKGVDLPKIDVLHEKLVRAEAKLLENNPVAYNLLAQSILYQQCNEKLNRQIHQYQEMLETKKSDFDVSKSNSFQAKKVVEIAEFYHYEYEILPNWFKKLGHLIKVIMGKRTVKSLYDDNVKKYK